MHELVIAAGVTFLIVVLSISLVAGLLLRTLSRSNRVLPERRSPAPMSWLWSWAAPARLHRRLRRAVQAAACVVAPLRPPSRGRRRPQPPASPLVGVADDLMARAADLDDRLVAASRVAPQWRSQMLADLRRGVAEVEASAAHLGRVAAAWRSQMDASGLYEPVPALDLRSRLTAVEAALWEVAHVGDVRRPGAASGPAGTPEGPAPSYATNPVMQAAPHGAGPLGETSGLRPATPVDMGRPSGEPARTA